MDRGLTDTGSGDPCSSPSDTTHAPESPIRPEPHQTPPVTFGEAPAGSAIPVREWYPTGSNTGHRFLYR